MKNKTLMFLACGVCSISCLAVSALAFKNNDSNFVSLTNADNEPYVLTINSSLYDGGDTSGVDYTYVQTANGNNVKIKYNKLAPFYRGSSSHSQYTTGFNTLRAGSYIEIVDNADDEIHGLAGISNVSLKYAQTNEAATLRVSYGWDSEDMVDYYEQKVTSSDSGDISFDLEYNPTYIKIETIGSVFDFGLNEIKITYSCSPSQSPYDIYNNNYVLFNENDHYEIVAYKGEASNLSGMPTEYNNIPVTKIADNFRVKNGMSSLTNVYLSSSITTIGKNAFAYATNLEYINLDNVVRIEENAFLNDSKLASGYSAELNVSKVEYIGDRAFEYTNLTGEHFMFEASNLYLGENVFSFSNIRYVETSRDVNLEVNITFGNCPELITIYLPKNTNVKTKKINAWTIENCKELATLKYLGTKEEWATITKASNWCTDVPAGLQVLCDDGYVPIN